MTATAVIALALGIGLTTLMFSIVRGVLLRGLPFDGPDELVTLQVTNLADGVSGRNPGPHDFLDWRAQQTSFEDLAAFHGGTFNVSGGDAPPRRHTGSFVTPGLFPLVGVRPMLGRSFREDEGAATAPPVTVIGHQMWRDRFGSDPEAVGRALLVNGTPTTIVGVMPERFLFPLNDELWVPLASDPAATPRGTGRGRFVLGRLRDTVSRDAAQAEMATIAARLAETYPETNAGTGVRVDRFVDLFVGNEVGGVLTTMLVAVFAVLLVACANVANLLLARAATRTREIAVRTALGASRRHVVSQVVAEALVLSAAGALLGVGLAQIGITLFNAAIGGLNPPFWLDVGLDLWVVLFALGMTGLAALFSGLAPALRASRADITDALRDEGRSATSLRMGRLSRGLVVAEIALSCGLLAATGLAIQSVANLHTLTLSFPTEDVFVAATTLPPISYPTPADQSRFWSRLETGLRPTPGATVVGLTSAVPALGSQGARFAIEGAAAPTDRNVPASRRATVTPGFFEVFDVVPLRGRLLDDSDGASGTRVVVVNDSFAHRFFPGEDALGRRLRETGAAEAPWLTIVGIVPDLRMWDVETQDEHPAGYYVPLAQHPTATMMPVIRTAGEPVSLTAAARDVVASIDPTLPIYQAGSLAVAIEEAAWTFRIFGALFIVFGVAALALASIGLYAVVAFSTGQRTREIGLRLALGARRADVVRLVLLQGLGQVGVGVAIGLGLALALARLLAQLLFGVAPWDPGVFGAIVVTLVTVSLLASYLPARRALRVDPVIALRSE